MERLKTGIILLLLAALAGSIAWAATSGEAEVRITARRLADGRTEFALQQRVDGQWGERMVPAQRFFPATVNHERWLNSTPLTVSVEGDELTEDPSQKQAAPASTYTPTRIALSGDDNNNLIWSADDSPSGFRSFVGVRGNTSDPLYDEAFVYFNCDHDDPDARVIAWVRIFWAVRGDVNWASGFDRNRSASARFGTTYNSEFKSYGSVVTSGAVFLYDDNLLQLGKERRWLTVLIPDWRGDLISASFDLKGAFSTPVQPNLDNCGRERAAKSTLKELPFRVDDARHGTARKRTGQELSATDVVSEPVLIAGALG